MKFSEYIYINIIVVLSSTFFANDSGLDIGISMSLILEVYDCTNISAITTTFGTCGSVQQNAELGELSSSYFTFFGGSIADVRVVRVCTY